ncbi:hypothetical protein [Streptomyces sudanensis]|uniref:hypothetical protein n=1 Tax=Streptomyces sudanensis TaxID=436397 RepID=UPI0020CCE246|nr:hypothetical protein [Streptomyces sudanensis]MCP9956493.1 hypothetical protein [Streptomyces sudanensis]MCQ0002897.1 hypothetical protein [Streptomyces sudanensis]
MNQIGDKPEEVRRHHEEARHAAGAEDGAERPERPERSGDDPEEDRARGALPDGGASGDGASGDGASGDGAPGDGASGDGTPGDGASGDGAYDAYEEPEDRP